MAVEAGTTEQTDAQTQAKACTKAGKTTVTVLSFGNQSEANLAVSSGRADVGFADSQVAGYIVATSNGVFQNSGTAFEVAPYGLALPKGNGMATPVQAAVNAPDRQRRLHQDPDQVGRAGRGGDQPRSSTAPPARGPAPDQVRR